MNWEAIGAVGEVLGSIAVLATLVYLAVQVRHARSEYVRSISQTRYATIREVISEPMRNPDLLRILVKADQVMVSDPKTLSELEAIGDFTGEESRLLNIYCASDWLYRVETIENLDHISQDQKVAFDRSTKRLYGAGVGKLWYEDYLNNRTGAEPIVEYVNTLLDRGAQREA